MPMKYKFENIFLRSFVVGVLLALGGCATPPSQSAIAAAQYNKNFIKSFYQEIFVDKNLDRAKVYIVDDYIQHNPWGANGRESFQRFFKYYFKENPGFTLTIKRIIADDNHVVVHAHGRNNPSDKGVAVIDIYRIDNNKIVEHWDVVQNVVESVENNNTMF